MSNVPLCRKFLASVDRADVALGSEEQDALGFDGFARFRSDVVLKHPHDQVLSVT